MGNGVCTKCLYFRRVKPASQLLGGVLTTTDAAVSNALSKIVEDEQKQRDAEAEYKRAQAAADNDVWSMQPVMSDYCGFRESEAVYLIAEVKNFGMRCTDFKEGRPERHACADCAHRVEPTGLSEDAAMEQTYAEMARSSVASGVQPSNPDNLLSKYREGVASRKGFEISGIYAAHGVLAAKPKYFAYCGKLSESGDEFHICVTTNPHHTCSLWTKGTAAPQPAAVPSAVAAATPSPAKPAPALPRLDIKPSAVGMSAADPNVVLAPGTPPLTRGMAVDMIGFFEWILDVQYAANTREELEQYLVSKWQQNDANEIANVLQQLQLFAQVKAATPAMRAYWREENQAQIVAALRASNEPIAIALLTYYDLANEPLAAGDPPLTREMADSTLRLLAFIQAASQNGRPMAISAAAAENWRAQLVQHYGEMSNEQRQAIAAMPRMATMVEAAWEQMPEGDRAAYAEQLRQQFGGVLPAAPVWTAPATSAAATTTPPSRPATTFNAPTVSEQPEAGPMELMDQIIAAQKKEEDELMKSNPELAFQKKLQNQQQNAQMMSNMMKIMHDTSMAIIGNIR